VVTYTGNGVRGNTISHNLGTTPGCIIIKRTNASESWAIYHRSRGATKHLRFSTDAEFDELSRYILANYDEIEHHHKYLVTKGDLEAGTYLGEYPERVKGAVRSYRNEIA
jgi:hypothetical protein